MRCSGRSTAGWGVTMSTLGYERAGVIEIAGNLISEVESFLRQRGGRRQAQRARPRSWRRHLHPCAHPRLAGRAVARAATATGPNGAVAGLIKLAWSTLGQSFAEYAADVDGLAAIAGDDMRSGRRLVGSRSNTIAGGTTEVMKNIIGERSLGLPREPKV